MGDYAIVKVPGETHKEQNKSLSQEIRTAGLFDDFWRLAPREK
jgi:hypothetical protein